MIKKIMEKPQPGLMKTDVLPLLFVERTKEKEEHLNSD